MSISNRRRLFSVVCNASSDTLGVCFRSLRDTEKTPDQNLAENSVLQTLSSWSWAPARKRPQRRTAGGVFKVGGLYLRQFEGVIDL